MAANTDNSQVLGELWYLPGSPWSIRTKWALEVCGATVTLREYRPVLDEFALWFRLGCPLRGKITVPVLFPAQRGASPIRESVDIAAFADEQASHGLFPQNLQDEIRSICSHADTVLCYCRGTFLNHLRGHPENAAALFLPPFLQGKPFSNWIAMKGLSSFATKYQALPREEAVKSLEYFRATLQASNFKYMLEDRFTYADICVGCAIYFVAQRRLLIPENRSLNEEFQDLVKWSENLFQLHMTKDLEQVLEFKK